MFIAHTVSKICAHYIVLEFQQNLKIRQRADNAVFVRWICLE